jgi:thioredoxin-like negative regulator of GroEL
MKTKMWIEKEEFEKEILNSDSPRIVLFAADWCGYCSKFLSAVSKFKDSEGYLPRPTDELAVVNVDSGDGSLWDQYKLDLVPTLAVFCNRKQIFRRDGRALIGLRESDLVDAISAAGESVKGA